MTLKPPLVFTAIHYNHGRGLSGLGLYFQNDIEWGHPCGIFVGEDEDSLARQ